MDSQKLPKPKTQRSAKLTKSRAVESSNESSDDNSDEEVNNLGSRINLVRDKHISAKSSRKSRSEKPSAKSDIEESENTIVEIESTEPAKLPQVPKESSLAQSIKRKFGFFRKSENVKLAEDVEAAIVENVEAKELKNQQIVDVVVDVHCENEDQKSKTIKKNVISKSFDDPEKSDDDKGKSSADNVIVNSLDLIEEFHENETKNKNNSKNNYFDQDSDDKDVESEIDIPIRKNRENDKSIQELTSEILPTSGRESTHQRKRWDKFEISADDLVEDLKKPRRKQWVKGAASAEIRKSTGKKIVPKRSATADPQKSVRPKSAKSSKPVVAPRTKSVGKENNQKGYDNDGFSSDHDEILRIETVNDQSPKIKIGSAEKENNEDEASVLNEEEEKIVNNRRSSIEIKEYLPETTESTENSEIKESLTTESNESPNLIPERRSISRRRSSSNQKLSGDKKSLNGEDEDDEIDEDEEELDTVLNVMDKKSRRSSSSSKIEIIPSNFFKKESSDETTISTNEEMHTPRKDTHRLRSRSKSKSSRRERSDDADASERSSRTKRKTTNSSTRNSAEEYSSSRRRRSKSRTKKRHKKRENKELEDVQEELKYISVRIHRSDMLEADYITRHPMVKVHIVYADTGEYLKMYNKEPNGNGVLQPIITGKFDFKEKKSMMPVWEEELIFEQDFKDLLMEDKGAALILFEVVDLLNFTEASICYDQFGRDSCWYKVAWAFLRPVGVSGVRHIDKKIRLQLYRPKKSCRKSSKSKCEVYKWWKSNSRDKYPSSLYVSITAVDPPKLEPVFYEQLLQLNDLSEMQSDSQNILSPKTNEETIDPPKWTRLAAQSCQIPNEACFETEAGENGCFYVAFSNDGKFLACVLSEEYDYPILVYKIVEGKIHARFSGHKNFVYSLSWSKDDRYLLSVSSDQTARFWDVREKIIEHVQSLPHPSYVYCGKFAPDSTGYIVTGCYDHVARVWVRIRPGNKQQYELVQELEAHESFVSAICFQPKDDNFLTGDGFGIVIVWSSKKSRRSPIRKEWQMIRKVKIRELEGIPINTILMHPLGSRLIVHSRNNGLRLVDLISGVVVKKFEGLKNQRIHITACISPCGTLLFCGGENSTLFVWNIDSGKLIANYEIDSHEKAITCVDYHPYDHVVAFAVYGAPLPVKILKFDRDADGRNVGLKLLSNTMSIMSTSSINRLKESMVIRNGGRNLEKLSVRSLNSSVNISQIGSVGHLLNNYKDDDDVRKHLKGKLQKFMDSGPTLKAKSMNRLNGIIEKIDRILMYATNQKSPAMDLESARNSSIYTFEESQRSRPRERVQAFELEDLTVKEPKKHGRKIRKHRQRSRSARNACSPTEKDIEFSKAFSDSVAFNRKVSKFSDESSNSNRSVIHDKFIVERLELEKIDYADTESGFKDSLETIVDGKEDFPSEEILDVESLKSDDTYVVGKENKSPESEVSSNKSNATFIIESEVPVPKPRKRVGRIEVM